MSQGPPQQAFELVDQRFAPRWLNRQFIGWWHQLLIKHIDESGKQLRRFLQRLLLQGQLQVDLAFDDTVTTVASRAALAERLSESVTERSGLRCRLVGARLLATPYWLNSPAAGVLPYRTLLQKAQGDQQRQYSISGPSPESG